MQGDTDDCPPGMTGGSRALPVGGAAVLAAGSKSERERRSPPTYWKRRSRTSSSTMGTPPSGLRAQTGPGLFDVRRASLEEKNLPEGLEPGLDETHERQPDAATFPNGCHVCEIEVDPDTGEIRSRAIGSSTTRRHHQPDDAGRPGARRHRPEWPSALRAHGL